MGASLMKKVNILRNYGGFLSVILLIAASMAVLALVYLQNGITECYWRNEDCDFCYALSALRYLDGISMGKIDHPGYPLIQLLGWYYTILTNVNVLKQASFQAIATDPDPLGAIKNYVIAGWGFGAVIHVLFAFLVYRFSYMISGSRVVSLSSAALLLVSLPHVQFIQKIRPEALSSFFGFLSMFFMFKSTRSQSLYTFLLYFLMSSTLLALAVFTKLNALPFVALVPLILVLEHDNAITKLPVKHLLTILAAWIPSLIFLTFGFAALTFARSTMVHKSALLIPVCLTLWLTVIMAIHECCFSIDTEALRQRVVRLFLITTIFVTLFCAGWVFAVIIMATLHPSFWIPSNDTIHDIAVSIFIVANPGIATQYMTVSPTIAGVLGSIPANLGHYLSLHTIELGVIVSLSRLLWDRYGSTIRLAWFLLFSSLILSIFSSLRSTTATWYEVYEETAVILGLAAALGASAKWLSAAAPHTGDQLRSRFLQSAPVFFFILLVSSRAAVLATSVGSLSACPPLPDLLRANDSCVCNPLYAGQTGMKYLIESAYGLQCEKSVEFWFESGYHKSSKLINEH